MQRTLSRQIKLGALACVGAILLTTSSSARTNSALVDAEYDTWTESAEPEPATSISGPSADGEVATARCRFVMWTVPLDTYANLGYSAIFYDPNDNVVDSQVNWQYKPGLSGYLLAENVQPGVYRCVVTYYLEANSLGTDEAYFLGSAPAPEPPSEPSLLRYLAPSPN